MYKTHDHAALADAVRASCHVEDHFADAERAIADAQGKLI
jgi:hypothetical protein